MELFNRLGLFSLEYQRLRGDLKKIYTIMRGINRVCSWKHSPRREISNTRGHSFTVRGEKFKGIVWKVRASNAQPGVVMEADKVVAIERLG